MSAEIRLVIPGEPMGKQRPRVTRTGHAYTPTKTLNYEAVVRERFAAEYPGWEPLRGGVELRIVAWFGVPRSASKRKRGLMLAQRIPCTKRPDWDNIGKITDALNGIAWVDDAQIVDGRVIKCWGHQGNLEITIKSVDQDGSEEGD